MAHQAQTIVGLMAQKGIIGGRVRVVARAGTGHEAAGHRIVAGADGVTSRQSIRIMAIDTCINLAYGSHRFPPFCPISEMR